MRPLEGISLRIERAAGVIARKGRKEFVSEDYRTSFLFYLAKKGVRKGFLKNLAQKLGVCFDEIDEFIEEGKRIPDLREEIGEFISYLANQPSGHTTTPLRATLWIANTCNLRCKHCGNSSGSPGENELTTRELRDIIQRLGELDVMKVSITGGEPLLREDVYTILRHASKNIPYVFLTTNGWLCADKEVARRVARYVHSVKISLDGMKFHDWLRGEGSFERAVQSIRNFLEFGVGVKIQTTLMRQNIREIIPMIEFLAREVPEIYRVDIVPVSIIGRAKKEFAPPPELYRDFKNSLEKKHFPFNVRLVHTFCNSSCQALRTLCDISYDGTVYPCSFLRIPLGNVREEDILDIWTSENANYVRKILSPEFLLTSCEYRYSCNGGCAANGVIMKTAHLCDRYCWRRWDYAGLTSKDI